MADFLFWFSLLFIVYVYFGYPLILLILANLFPKPVVKRHFTEWPSVTVVIAAKNEADTIQRRIENIFSQDYPQDRLEVIVVSDGSADSTVAIVNNLIADRGDVYPKIKMVPKAVSTGKPETLNLGVKEAQGELIVFADARQQFSGDALKNLIANFNDAEVGGVSGELHFVDNESSGLAVEMGVYWKYEKFVRKMESRCGSVVGTTGAIYAIRKELYQELPQAALLDDVLVPIFIVSQGFRVVYDSLALAYDTVSSDVKGEWRRKVRTLTGNWQMLSIAPTISYVIQGRILWRFFSHKIGRLLVPFFLIILFASGFAADGPVYVIASCGQVLFYGVALSAFFLKSLRKNKQVRLVYFFCVMNLAAAYSFFVWISGGSSRVWK